MVVILMAITLILLLALGVYASNRLLTHWLIERSLEHTLAQIPVALQKAGLEEQLPDPRSGPPARHSTGDPPGDQIPGLQLRSTIDGALGAPPPGDLPGRALTRAERDVILPLLKPAELLSARAFSARDLQAAQSDPAPLLLAALDPDPSGQAGPNLPVAAVAKKTGVLLSENRAGVAVAMDFIGRISPHVLMVLPNRGSDGGMQSGLLLVTDQSVLLRSISGITALSSGLIAALCGISVLFAGILLWLRFRDQVRTTRDIEYLAHHDALTGLPNRAVFNARLNETLRLTQAKASNMGVMLIDVDKFKEINDTYGHGTGDLFLQIVANQLKSVFGDHLVARLSGDEFAVMTHSVSDIARLTRLASEMIASTDLPCVINGKEIKISLSIGIARASDGNWRASRLLHCADLALYSAKRSGRSTFVWYTSEMDADAQKRKEIEAGLVKALRFGQFELLFQPQYSLTDNQLKGYESLIRWNHPTKGTIPPDVFIPVAEETGLIEQIGDWVLNRACQEAVSWPDQTLRIAVNVSGAQFSAGETQKKVAKALRETGLDPRRLEIEITESLLISDTDAVVETLQQIREMGVAIAMDDFGTGYSSLSYLSRFPFDKIKIDRSFVQNLGEDAGTDAIVTSIIGLGRSLDVLITAEGVETPEQVTLLRAAGCDMVQGYLYGRPGSVEAHEEHRARLGYNRAEFWDENDDLVPLRAMAVARKPGSEDERGSASPQQDIDDDEIALSAELLAEDEADYSPRAMPA
ncbi:hypothetical protein GCM10011316_05230 [Roseibium aquae]|uniref:Diguanylate cyclase (GGDEF)-like protein n=2 Tax=Roseibium aquae TaxID=1323746 RepID=A0A916TAG0_9HYPH|nr:hypothetical protein GCM10011316_05230 [Roseibium aquae]